MCRRLKTSYNVPRKVSGCEQLRGLPIILLTSTFKTAHLHQRFGYLTVFANIHSKFIYLKTNIETAYHLIILTIVFMEKKYSFQSKLLYSQNLYN